MIDDTPRGGRSEMAGCVRAVRRQHRLRRRLSAQLQDRESGEVKVLH